MAERGITPAGILADLESGDLGGWVEEREWRDPRLLHGRHAATARSSRSSQSPAAKAMASARACSTVATQWLAERGHDEAWLSTDANSIAARFYANRGWRRGEMKDHEDVYFHLSLR